MKRIVLLITAAMLGLSAPAAASAQRARDFVDGVIQVQQGRPDRGDRDRDRGDRGGRVDRGDRNDRGGGRPPQGEARPNNFDREPPRGREISMSQAIRIVEGYAAPGHHLDGSREDQGGRAVYRIRWATDRGERRDYIVDAQTGAILR